MFDFDGDGRFDADDAIIGGAIIGMMEEEKNSGGERPPNNNGGFDKGCLPYIIGAIILLLIIT